MHDISDEQIIRAAVQAMPHTNPEVADDLLGGHAIHAEAADIVAIWRAASEARAAPSPHSTKENGDCPHWCKACAKEREAREASATGAEGEREKFEAWHQCGDYEEHCWAAWQAALGEGK